jgi:1,4-alpha-glucan branching enzyme
MNTKDMPARDRHEDRSLRQEKLGRAPESFPSKNLVDREPAVRKKAHRPDKKRASRGLPSPAQSKATETQVVFHLDAPNATQVCVAGCFNDWNPVVTPLRNDANGTWSACVKLPPGVYQYRFIVDGEWRDDPGATQFAENPFGTRNGVLNVQ